MSYELRNNGNAIMVPRDNVARLRMTLAETGLPKGGGVGYEIFDKSDTLGTTSFVQKSTRCARSKANSRARSAGWNKSKSPRASGLAGTAAVFARQGRAVGLDRVQVRGTLEPGQVRAIVISSPPPSPSCGPSTSRSSRAGPIAGRRASNDTNGGDVGADERQVAFEKQLRQQVEGTSPR